MKHKEHSAPRAGEPPGEPRIEPWVKAAYAVLALAVALTFYLGSRPGGPTPVRVYGLWFVPGLLSAVLLAFSLAWGALHRPLLQRGRLKGWISLAACLAWSVFPFPYPSSHEGHPSRVELRLPAEGEWGVVFAGDRYRENPLVLRPASRFGVGLRRADAGGPGAIMAPCECTEREVDPGGDRLVLALPGGELLSLHGIEEPAPGLEVGASLAPGAPLGRGRGLDVYLHDVHGEGIPMRFSSFTEDGRPQERGALRRGTRVAPIDGKPGFR